MGALSLTKPAITSLKVILPSSMASTATWLGERVLSSGTCSIRVAECCSFESGMLADSIVIDQ